VSRACWDAGACWVPAYKEICRMMQYPGKDGLFSINKFCHLIQSTNHKFYIAIIMPKTKKGEKVSDRTKAERLKKR